MEVILVMAWVMVVILSIIMDMEPILFTTIMDSIMVVDVIRFITTGTVVNLQNGFNPWSDVFRGLNCLKRIIITYIFKLSVDFYRLLSYRGRKIEVQK
ncbi:hypothetical protein [Neobacillus terrae]|uniref:hypothetical protein n=1 Tax=Neobacillus terrae TaxID=3034837 RepID=UPI00140CE814|nr:hypothetical protein [Neobacillus terrae]